MKAVLFTNTTEKDFVHSWNKAEYTFPAGQSMMLEEPLALHFAKHLAVRELNLKGENTGGGSLKRKMNDYFNQKTSIQSDDPTKLKQEVINYKDKKKVVKKKKVEDKTEEFEGLDETTK